MATPWTTAVDSWGHGPLLMTMLRRMWMSRKDCWGGCGCLGRNLWQPEGTTDHCWWLCWGGYSGCLEGGNLWQPDRETDHCWWLCWGGYSGCLEGGNLWQSEETDNCWLNICHLPRQHTYTYIAHVTPTLSALGPVASRSRPTRLLWLQRDPWQTKYRSNKHSLKFWTFVVTLTLKTATQYVDKIL